MKIYLFLIITFTLFSSNLFAQGETVELKQLCFGSVAAPNNVTHTITRVAPNTEWKRVDNNYILGGVISNSLTTLGDSDTNKNSWPGFNFIWFVNTPHWALGLYKVSNNINPSCYFYLDARDGNYGLLTNPDIYLRYDHRTGKYGYFKDTTFTIVQNGELV